MPIVTKPKPVFRNGGFMIDGPVVIFRVPHPAVPRADHMSVSDTGSAPKC